MENKSHIILLELLKSALWNSSLNESSIIGVDWGDIYRLAKEQAVLALCLDGINHLPHELMPSEERNREKWIGISPLQRKVLTY